MPNAQLAQRILDHITAEPRQFNMSFWFQNPGSGDNELAADEPLSCGTTMCIAGWACRLEGYSLVSNAAGVFAVDSDQDLHDIQDHACRLLGIGPEHRNLFHQDEPVAVEMLRQIIEGRELSARAAEDTVEREAADQIPPALTL